MQNFLAIIIPYYKLAFFRETVQSLAAQTDQRFHLYIGNDASPEDPQDLLSEFTGKINFTYKRFDENWGGKSLTKQWERCIDMMQDEEWFMILGDDDVLSETVVKDFYANWREIDENSNVVRFSTVVIDADGEIISEIYTHDRLQSAVESYIDKLNGVKRSSLSEYIFRRNVYEKYHFLDVPFAWGSDDYAVIQFSENKPIYSLESLVNVRISNFNITGFKTLKKEKIEGDIFIVDKLLRDNRSLSTSQVERFIHQYNDQLYRLGKINIKLELILLTLLFKKTHFKVFRTQINTFVLRILFNIKKNLQKDSH